jgi:hypothetical protein
MTRDGMDRVVVGDSTNRLDAIDGDVSVLGDTTGQVPHDRLEVFDHGSVSGQQYARGTTALQRPGAGAITFTNLNEVGVLAGAGADQVTAASLPPIPTFDFDLGAGMDRVRGPDAAETVWGVGIGRLTLDDMLIFVHADEVVGGSGTNASSSATVRS